MTATETAAATSVTEAVQRIVAREEYPSAGRIEREMGKRVRHNLNGRQCREREQALRQLGWTHTYSTAGGHMNGYGARWTPPVQ